MNYFLSIETTGLPNDKKSSIIKATMIDADGQLVFNELFKPEFNETIVNTQFHGIINEMVSDKPTFNSFFNEKLNNFINNKDNKIFVYLRDFVLKMVYKHINLNNNIDDKAIAIAQLNNCVKDLSKISQELYGIQGLKEKTKVKLENSYPFYQEVENLLIKYHFGDQTLKKCIHLLFIYNHHIQHKNLSNIEDIIKTIKNNNAEEIFNNTSQTTQNTSSDCRIELNFDKTKKYISKVYINNKTLYIYKNKNKYYTKDFNTDTTGTVEIIEDKIKININNKIYWLSDFKKDPKNIILKDSNKKTKIVDIRLFDSNDLNTVGSGKVLVKVFNRDQIFELQVNITNDNTIDISKINEYLNNTKFELFEIVVNEMPIGRMVYNKENKQLLITLGELKKQIKAELNNYSAKVITENIDISEVITNKHPKIKTIFI
jgi:hypothetical protein